MPLVVDASVAVKWLVKEDGSDRAEALKAEDLHAPSLIRIEVANVLRTLATSGRLKDAEALQALDLLLDAPVRLYEPTDALMRGALAFALRLRHPIYDCLYLALAVELGTRLVTADRRFHRATERLADTEGLVVLLDQSE